MPWEGVFEVWGLLAWVVPSASVSAAQPVASGASRRRARARDARRVIEAM
jgi:hypothetical protein